MLNHSGGPHFHEGGLGHSAEANLYGGPRETKTIFAVKMRKTNGGSGRKMGRKVTGTGSQGGRKLAKFRENQGKHRPNEWEETEIRGQIGDRWWGEGAGAVWHHEKQ